MSNLDKSQSEQNCSNKRDCLEMLQLFLDGEVTPEQKHHFRTHLDECMPCFQQYHLDMAIRELLKLNCSSQAPPDLIETIKSKISHNTPH